MSRPAAGSAARSSGAAPCRWSSRWLFSIGVCQAHRCRPEPILRAANDNTMSSIDLSRRLPTRHEPRGERARSAASRPSPGTPSSPNAVFARVALWCLGPSSRPHRRARAGAPHGFALQGWLEMCRVSSPSRRLPPSVGTAAHPRRGSATGPVAVVATPFEEATRAGLLISFCPWTPLLLR